jgi:hypothetical protein
MGLYKVNFGDYCLAHSDDYTYFNYFELNGKKYPIGAYIKLTDKGMSELFYGHGYNYIKNGFRLVDHYITENGHEKWEYIIGHLYNSNLPVMHKTYTRPEELISEVLCQPIDEAIYTPGELQVEFKESEFNCSPKDCEVEGVMLGWFVMVLVWIIALVFKDWWITLLIQISAGLCFGSWREKKINEAISTQKFKKRD